MYDRLIYASRAVGSPDEVALVELLQVSRDCNAAGEVTGMLVYAERSFMQMIEGPADAITDTYGRIVKDDRHETVRLLLHERVDERLFPDWTMGFYQPDAAALVERLSGYRAERAYPFVSGELVPNGDVATTLMRLWASDVG
jgi:hypothetical protein